MGRFQTQTNLAFDFYQFYLYTALNSACILMCSQAKYMLTLLVAGGGGVVFIHPSGFS